MMVDFPLQILYFIMIVVKQVHLKELLSATLFKEHILLLYNKQGKLLIFK